MNILRVIRLGDSVIFDCENSLVRIGDVAGPGRGSGAGTKFRVSRITHGARKSIYCPSAKDIVHGCIRVVSLNVADQIVSELIEIIADV